MSELLTWILYSQTSITSLTVTELFCNKYLLISRVHSRKTNNASNKCVALNLQLYIFPDLGAVCSVRGGRGGRGGLRGAGDAAAGGATVPGGADLQPAPPRQHLQPVQQASIAIQQNRLILMKILFSLLACWWTAILILKHYVYFRTEIPPPRWWS